MLHNLRGNTNSEESNFSNEKERTEQFISINHKRDEQTIEPRIKLAKQNKKPQIILCVNLFAIKWPFTAKMLSTNFAINTLRFG